MSYGYGLSASLLQLAQAYTVFARDGELIPLTMLKADEGATPVAGRRVFEPGHAQRRARDAAPGRRPRRHRAQGAGPGLLGGRQDGHRAQARRQGLQHQQVPLVLRGPGAGVQPRIVVAVMVDEPSKGIFYAGEVAAPVFSQVVQQTLR
jgi:cell division protein FtsI (penicillin-binding protein 3)